MVAQLCKKHKIFLIVDNIFATPLVQSPFSLGADCVVYSTTKHFDGQGRTLGGAVLGRKDFIEDELLPFVRHTGPALSPINAWIIFKSLETFELRFQRHCENALEVARFLEKHEKIDFVLYPYLDSHPQYKLAKKQMKNGSSLISFSVKGGQKEAFAFMNKLKVIDISNNLGDSKTLITHPATSTHSNIDSEEQINLGITQSLVRLSIGLEDKRDLIQDIKEAL